MNNSDEIRPAGQKRDIRVWDLPVRLVHWLLALTIFGCWLTETLGVAWMQWHMRLGYLALGLAVFRILWGLVGPRYARFSDFLHGPRAVVDYVRSWLKGAPAAHAGHNPLAGWAVMLMLGCILLQAGTGLFHTDDILTAGPMRAAVSADLADRLGGLHAANADVLWILIGLHFAALLAHRYVAGERLAGAMWTGRKAGDFPPGQTDIASSRLWLALGLGAAVTLAIWLLLTFAPDPAPASFDFS
jgi:cytochrome b